MSKDSEIYKVTYRTPDYMLCSVQDYLLGEPGNDEHLWQATLDPQAVVFVNHPRNMSTNDAQRANFWRGNHRLPRVIQWHNVLMAIHNSSSDDWLGFTHAHCPTYAFDQYNVQDVQCDHYSNHPDTRYISILFILPSSTGSSVATKNVEKISTPALCRFFVY